MIRAVLYLLASAVAWFAEGYVFSRFLRFSIAQTIILGLVYLALFLLALLFLRSLATDLSDRGELPIWRYLSLAPALTLIVGSFASLPILLAIAALGKL
ncbi:MAG TPA: hypothetical protein VFB58_09845 [Chloroflexota bacterium]|nr:hypothetical protein [Chloroflexota bacterium]